MDLRQLLTLSLLVLTLVIVGLSTASALRRAWRLVATRRHESMLAAVRPHLMERLAIADPEAGLVLDRSVLPGRSDERSVEELVGGLLPKLRGEDHGMLARHLERSGALERARLRTYSRRRLVRARAATLVGAAQWRRALPELVWLLRDPDVEVRSVAARAIGRMGAAEAVPYLIGALEAPRRSISASVVGIALVHLGPASAPLLIGGLDSAPAATRSLVAEVLGLMGAQEAVDHLCQQLSGDPETLPRIAAAHALGRVGAPDALDGLIAAVSQHEAPALRIAAARALGDIGDPAAIDALSLMMADPSDRVARAAGGALSALGSAGYRSLERAATENGLRQAHAMEELDLRDRVRPLVAR